MKKMKIIGLGNKDELNWLIVKKEEGFFEWLNTVLTESFGNVSPDVDYYDTIKINEKVVSKKKKIKEYSDVHESYDAEEIARIEVFYGNEKVFITVLTSLKNRKILMSCLEKYSNFIE